MKRPRRAPQHRRCRRVDSPPHLCFVSLVLLLLLFAAAPSPSPRCLIPAAAAFLLAPKFAGRRTCQGASYPMHPPALSASPTDDDDAEHAYDDYDNDDDDETIIIKPYGSRSLAWTKRYRKLNPYEKVRRRVLKFGHRSKEDWDECVSSGQQGQYVPARPDEMYAPEWVSWDEFLGIMRPYDETRNIAVNVLRLKSFDDYILFVQQNPKRAEGLRIPLRPDLFYKDEWIDADHFFGRN